MWSNTNIFLNELLFIYTSLFNYLIFVSRLYYFMSNTRRQTHTIRLPFLFLTNGEAGWAGLRERERATGPKSPSRLSCLR